LQLIKKFPAFYGTRNFITVLEEVSLRRYQRAAEKASPELARLLRELAAEEEGHLRFLRNLPADQKGDEVWACQLSSSGTGSSGRTRAVPADDAAVVAALIENEDATAAFYRELANRTLLPSVRAVLSRLADEETGHAKRLREIGASLKA
jgi:rubrerythrin